MIKNLVRFTVIAYVWRRYKTIIISTVTLFAYFWLVNLIHSDFIELSQLKNDSTYLGTSYAIKWLALLTGVSIYLSANSWIGKQSKSNQNTDTLLNMKHSSQPNRNPEENNRILDNQDPFSEIRKKKKLRSNADFIIENNKES